MKQKFNSTAKIFLALMVFLPSAALADDEFDRAMVSYSASQKIASQMAKKKNILKVSRQSTSSKSQFDWSDYLQDDFRDASKNRINADRIKMLGEMISQLNSQIKNGFEEFDNTVSDIMKEAFTYEDDLVYPIAICVGLRAFMSHHKTMFKRNSVSVRKVAIENLESCEKEIIEKIQKRFEDEDLKELVAEYKKLYPNEELLFSSTAPAQFAKVLELFEQCMKSFRNLNRNSAIAEFRLWGRDMLNVLILSNNPVLIKEFKLQLDNHKKVFR